MAVQLFMTAQEVIDLSFTNKSTDAVLISDAIIQAAQVGNLKPVFREDFYDELLLDTSTGDLDSDEAILRNDYIKPTLAYYVKELVLSDLMVNTSSMGPQTQFSEFSSPATGAQMNNLKIDTRRIADMLLRQMIDFLDDETENDSTKFDEWDGDGIRNVRSRAGIIFTRNSKKAGGSFLTQSRGIKRGDFPFKG